MAETPRIGTAQLAEEVLDRFDDLNGLSAHDIEDLELDNDAGKLLQEVMGWGSEGLITSEERLQLKIYFTDEFVAALAGPDDKPNPAKALSRKVSAFSPYVVSRWYRLNIFDKKPEERVQMLLELGDMGIHAKKALPNVLEALEEYDERICFTAAETLGRIGDDAKDKDPRLMRELEARAVPALRSILRKWEAHRLPAVLKSLGQIASGPGIIPDLRWALASDKPWQVRQSAAFALGENAADAAEAIHDLISALEGTHWVARDALLALAKIAAHLPNTAQLQLIVKSIIPHLAHQEIFVRQAAHDSLVAIGPLTISHIVTSLLENSSGQKRRILHVNAASVLGDIAQNIPSDKKEFLDILLLSAVPALVWVMEDDPYEDVHQAVSESLVKIALKQGGETVLSLVEGLQKPVPEPKQHLAWVLGEIFARGRAADKNLHDQLIDIGIPELNRLLGALNSWAVRKSALEALVKFGPHAPSSVLILIGALHEWPPDEKEEVKKVLVAIGEPAVPALIRSFRQNPGELHEEEIDVLSQIGWGAVDPLIEALGSEEEFRTTAVAALSRIGNMAINPLIKASRDMASSDRREYAVRALGAMKPHKDDVTQALMDRLEDPVILVRDAAADSLVIIGKYYLQTIQELARALSDPQKPEELHVQIAEIFGKLSQKMRDEESGPRDYLIKQAVGALISSMAFGPNVQKAAVEALVQFDAWALSPVIDALTHPNPEIRNGALKVTVALKKISIPKTIEKLRSGSSLEQSQATSALIEMGATAVPELIRALRNWPQDKVERLVPILAVVAPPPFESLLWVLTDPNKPSAQNAAQKVFTAMEGAGLAGDLADWISLHVKSLQPKQKTVLISLLGKAGSARDPNDMAVWGQFTDHVVPTLLPFLQDSDAIVQKAAADALVDIGTAAVPALVNASDQPVSPQQTKARELLREIAQKNPALHPNREALLTDSNAAVREWILLQISLTCHEGELSLEATEPLAQKLIKMSQEDRDRSIREQASAVVDDCVER